MPSRGIVFWSVGAAAFVILPANKFVEVLTLPPQASALNVCAVKAIKMQPNSSEMETHRLAFMARTDLVCDVTFDLSVSRFLHFAEHSAECPWLF